jgi:uncharacterized protein (DUF2141 family)
MPRLLLLLALPLLASAPSLHAAELTVQVDGIDTTEGQVVVGVCRGSFEPSNCGFGARRTARVGTMRFAFTVPAGEYGIAVFHDRNGNGKLDTTLPGLPSEPYGFSNDIGRVGPPRYEGARFAVGDGPVTVRIRVANLFR